MTRRTFRFVIEVDEEGNLVGEIPEILRLHRLPNTLEQTSPSPDEPRAEYLDRSSRPQPRTAFAEGQTDWD